MSVRPVEFLVETVEGFEPYLQESGVLNDPVLREPTQYGTPYYAFCQAALSVVGPPERQFEFVMNAFHGFDHSLRYLRDRDQPDFAASIDRATGTVYLRSVRDHFWSPIMRTFRLLNQQGASMAEAFRPVLSDVAIDEAFTARPPDYRSTVWLSGEWIRMREALSSTSMQQFDEWLAPFFATDYLTRMGLYPHPGLPNSIDIFTRFHLADILVDGYDGAWREQLEAVMKAGLVRSLGVQLSDGSLASANRSTGHTYTLGAQIAFFTHAANFYVGRDPELHERAVNAARRAFASMIRWQREEDTFCAVENLHPPSYRVGYERYTMDGHFGTLALSFLAIAVLNGFHLEPLPAHAPRKAFHFLESDPTHRGCIHDGDYSVHVNAHPSSERDGFGITDITFGPGRFLHFVSSACHLETGQVFNVGLATRKVAGRSEIQPIAQTVPALLQPISKGQTDASLFVQGRVPGSVYVYELNAWIDEEGIEIEERTVGEVGYKTLLIPYPRNMGTGYHTHVRSATTEEGAVIRFSHQNEMIRLRIQGAVESILDLKYGYECRRGMCGLIRIDLRDPTDLLRYRFTVGR